MMTDMGRHDDELDEFDEFDDNLAIKPSTPPRVGTTASLGQADQLAALKAATG
jgi:hypothetical protein